MCVPCCRSFIRRVRALSPTTDVIKSEQQPAAFARLCSVPVPLPISSSNFYLCQASAIDGSFIVFHHSIPHKFLRNELSKHTFTVTRSWSVVLKMMMAFVHPRHFYAFVCRITQHISHSTTLGKTFSSANNDNFLLKLPTLSD